MLIPLLGILQSVPVLGFLAVTVTAAPARHRDRLGRYGELFEYDSESGQLVLGSDPAKVGV